MQFYGALVSMGCYAYKVWLHLQMALSVGSSVIEVEIDMGNVQMLLNSIHCMIRCIFCVYYGIPFVAYHIISILVIGQILNPYWDNIIRLHLAFHS